MAPLSTLAHAGERPHTTRSALAVLVGESSPPSAGEMSTTLTEEEVRGIETVPHYTHSEEQAYLMLYGEGVFDTIPIEAA